MVARWVRRSRAAPVSRSLTSTSVQCSNPRLVVRNDALQLVGIGDDIVQQLGPGDAGRYVAQLNEDETVEPAEQVAEAEQLPVLVGLAEGGDEFGHAPEPHPPTLDTGGHAQSGGEVCLVG